MDNADQVLGGELDAPAGGSENPGSWLLLAACILGAVAFCCFRRYLASLEAPPADQIEMLPPAAPTGPDLSVLVGILAGMPVQSIIRARQPILELPSKLPCAEAFEQILCAQPPVTHSVICSSTTSF